MKKILFPLLALFLVFGCGGGGGDDDGPLTAADIAGVYSLTKITVTEGAVKATVEPPEVSGSLTLTSAGTYSMVMALFGEGVMDRGTFAVSESTVIFNSSDGTQITGDILNDGRNLTMNLSEEGMTMVLEFNRS